MNSKMPKSQEQSEQLQNEKLVKKRSLRGKVAKLAVAAASVVGICAGMALPSQAINRVEGEECLRRDDFLSLIGDFKFCFANKGDTRVLIANVTSGSSGNNEGYLETNKGRINFTRGVFINMNGPTTIDRIVIY